MPMNKTLLVRLLVGPPLLASFLYCLFFRRGVFWPPAWILLSWFLLFKVAENVIISEDLARERREAMRRNGKLWDKVLVVLAMYPSWLGGPCVCSLQVFSPCDTDSFALLLAGCLFLLLGMYVTVSAMKENQWFSAIVRIQKDRGHQVCRTGPYAYVRHPGYVGMLFMYAGFAALFPSWPNWIVQVFGASLIMLRTYWEDNTLKQDLSGYLDYSRRVKYRILPLLF